MKKLNVKLLIWVAALAVLLGLGTVALHSFQAGRIARALLWQSQRAEEEEQLDVAAKFLARYLELDPGDSEERARLGRILADPKMATTPRGYQRALFVLEQVVTREPERHDSRRLLARMAMSLGRYASAQEHLLILHKANPKDSEMLDLLGRNCQAQKKPEEAKDWYQKAVEAAPQEIGPYERLARLLRLYPDKGKEKPRDPDEVMKRAVENNEHSVAARLARWNDIAETGFITRVGSLLNSAVGAEPKDSSKLDASTRAKLDVAEKDLARALELAPEDIEVLLAAAELDRICGRAQSAREHLRKGQRLQPNNPRIYRHQAAVELSEDKPADAVACLREGIKSVTSRQQGELRWTLANLLLDQGKADEAQEELARLEKGGYSRAALDYVSARLLVGEGKWSPAAHRFEQVRASLEAMPTLDRDGEMFLSQTNLYLGRCYEQLNDPGRQQAAFDRLAACNPSSSAAHLSLASAHVAAGRLDEALEQYKLALALPDVSAHVHVDYARLLILRNIQRGIPDWTAVASALDRAAQAQPEATEVVLLRAQMLLAQNKPDEARQIIEQARNNKPKEIEFHTALAGLALRRNDAIAASEILKQAERQAGDSIELRQAWAWYLSNTRSEDGKNEQREALAALVHDLDKFPPSGRARLLEVVSAASNRIGEGKQALALWDQLAKEPLCRNDLRVQFGLAELALQVGDDALVRRGLDEVQRIEGGQGTLSRLGEAIRLIRRGIDATSREQARALLDAAAAARPGWAAINVARGELFERDGHPEKALNEYREAIHLGERSPRVVRRALELFNRDGRFAEAAQVLRQLKKQAPLTEELKRLEVDIALHNRDSDNAIQRALELVNPDSNDYRDVMWLGQVLKESGQRPEQAERHLRRAVELGPAVPETWIALIEFLASQQHLEQAEAEIAKAQAKLPKDQADLALAQCYEYMGKPDTAKKHYAAALAARPHDAVVLRAAAGFCISNGRLQEAEGHLRQLRDKETNASDADAVWARRNLAWVRAAAGGAEGLSEALDLVGLNTDGTAKVSTAERNPPTGLDRQEEQARARVLAVLAVHNRPKFRGQAIQILEMLNTRETLSADDLYLLAQLHEANSNWTRARQEFQELLTMQSEIPVFLAHYAQSLIRKGELEEARSCLERLESMEQKRRVESGRFGSTRLRAAYLEARGEQDKALELRRANAARKDAKPEELILLIRHLAGRKQTEDALAACEEAWKKCPADDAARASLATLHSVQPTDQQIARVEGWLRAFQEKSPDAVSPLLFLAELRDLQKKYDKAATLYRHVLKLDKSNITALNNLAWLLAQNTNGADEALALINQAIQVNGPTPGLLDTRATVNLARDQTKAAISDLQEANQASPVAPRLFQLARAHLKAKDRPAAAKAFAEAKRLGFDPKQLHPLQQEAASRVASELESR
jgi:tetratricopeptide (TPR) repeat protein